MTMWDDIEAKCNAFSTTQHQTVIPSLRFRRKGKPTLWLTPGMWYCYTASAWKDPQEGVVIRHEVTLVFRFWKFLYTKVINTSEATIHA